MSRHRHATLAAVALLGSFGLLTSCSVAEDAASRAVDRAVDTVQCAGIDALASQVPAVATLDQAGLQGLADTVGAIDRFVDELPEGTVSPEVVAALDRAAAESTVAVERYGDDPVVSEEAAAVAVGALDEAVASLRAALGC